MITDEHLLAACRSAGEPGSASHRAACRLYRRSVLEWQVRNGQWQDEYARQAAIGDVAALLAEALEEDDGRGVAGCGTRSGYNRHIREKTVPCLGCVKANAERAPLWLEALAGEPGEGMRAAA